MTDTAYRYCEDITRYKRLSTRTVYVGDIPMGSGHPVRIQSMTNTNTADADATVKQIKTITDEGADFVRMTTRTIKEAENLQAIKTQLLNEGYRIPLVADVHFNPRIAETAAKLVEKVRINPGNYSLKHSQKEAFKEIEENFTRLIEICKNNQTAIRIGVNHGSLSQRIMDQFGDTPKGMVESAMEFLRICNKHDFHQVVISLKSSNTRVMVQANRLMVHNMLREGMVYPLHLGVTEAGEGEDGRIKSAVGIGSLLADGIGDTVRVSLTEAPEKEIPVATTLVNQFTRLKNHGPIPKIQQIPVNPFEYSKRETKPVKNIGGTNAPVIIADINEYTHGSSSPDQINWQGKAPDFILSEDVPGPSFNSRIPFILPYDKWLEANLSSVSYPVFSSVKNFLEAQNNSDTLNFIKIHSEDLEFIDKLTNIDNVVLILSTTNGNFVASQRRFLLELINNQVKIPVILHRYYCEDNLENLQVKTSADLGPIFVDGLGEGLFIQNSGIIKEPDLTNLALGILQASRIRIFKTEFISCPGCGRTQFNLEKAVKKVRERLGHLKGLKIAVMGCVVNGPGEMADADYGYVGAGKGKVFLYKNKQLVKKNVPEEQAIDELIGLIKANDDWKE
jgi:(E)-4-hydroxy-3-methylbut-2-enyl-diphosphate synthase